MIDIQIKKLSEKAIMPKFNNETDHGMDLYSPIDVVVPAGERVMIQTNIAVQAKFSKSPDMMPLWEHFFKLGSFLKGCSGNAYKKGVEILGGVVDQNYTGDIGVVFLNTGKEDISIKAGDKICQLVFIISPKVTSMNEVKDFEKETDRGEKGFGSSGTVH